jgi:hypothetical protein
MLSHMLYIFLASQSSFFSLLEKFMQKYASGFFRTFCIETVIYCHISIGVIFSVYSFNVIKMESIREVHVNFYSTNTLFEYNEILNGRVSGAF